jgi:hypothetical protein
MDTRRGTLSFIELPVDTGRRGYMNCVPINIGCCPASLCLRLPSRAVKQVCRVVEEEGGLRAAASRCHDHRRHLQLQGRLEGRARSQRS